MNSVELEMYKSAIDSIHKLAYDNSKTQTEIIVTIQHITQLLTDFPDESLRQYQIRKRLNKIVE